MDTGSEDDTDVVTLDVTPGAQRGVSEGYADLAAGRTMSTDEARNRLGIETS
jgi:PHD/YefM family antitoxin component YafN of YafNO toxin-antitoxin module